MFRFAAAAAAPFAACLLLTPAFAQEMDPALVRGENRTEAPKAWRPAAGLHFLAVTPWWDGLFVDPASIRRSDGRVEVRAQTVGGEVRRIAEGDTRWTWARLDVDCSGRVC